MPKLARNPHAVIDIGSNSVRMVLFDEVKRTPISFFNEKVLCGLGEGLDETGQLPALGSERALNALRRFRIICTYHGLTPEQISCIATSAVRDASNKAAFIDAVEGIMGTRVDLLSGEEEAVLAAHGVLAGDPSFCGWVADLGGGSLELSEVCDGHINCPLSYPFGALRLGQRPMPEISGVLSQAFDDYGSHKHTGRLCVVGGAWRALGQVHMAQTRYPLKVLHHYDISAEEATRFSLQIKSAEPQEMRKLAAQINPARVKSLPYAGHVLSELINALQPISVTFSSHGIREGLVQKRLPARIRAEDPVAGGIATLERQYQLDPVRSREVYVFVRRLLHETPSPYLHLLEPICRLSNLAWRDHPNYRRGNVLHAILFSPIDGLTHKERIFAALALYYRYGGDSLRDATRLGHLLTSGDVDFAKTVGALLRFVHTLTGRVGGVLDKCSLTTQGQKLVFDLAPEFAALRGEAVEIRLQTLARLMGLKPVIQVI
ncbi:MAG: Ppx/GppA family phosphatase [Alphaproteobacteria bacterium]|nr:MAG: Ppx/GppA family phosphatase [Alphaproteobacteria bacterium]